MKDLLLGALGALVVAVLYAAAIAVGIALTLIIPYCVAWAITLFVPLVGGQFWAVVFLVWVIQMWVGRLSKGAKKE